MKWWIIIGLLALLCGYAPQLRTHYTPLPALARARRIKMWRYERPRWMVVFAIVRLT